MESDVTLSGKPRLVPNSEQRTPTSPFARLGEFFDTPSGKGVLGTAALISVALISVAVTALGTVIGVVTYLGGTPPSGRIEQVVGSPGVENATAIPTAIMTTPTLAAKAHVDADAYSLVPGEQQGQTPIR